MALDALMTEKKVIGSKQTAKAITRKIAVCVYLAEDADHRVIQPLIELCQGNDVPHYMVESMKELGKACGIEVGAAAVALVKEL